MSYPSFTVPLLIPGIVVGIPGIIYEMAGIALFDKIDELLYDFSSQHRKRFDDFAEQWENEHATERSAGRSSGNAQLSDFF